MQTEKLLISFSGGETSAYMTKWLLDSFKGQREMVVVFANTGQENEQTLEFLNRCDKELGFNVVWVEAVVHPAAGKGTTHKIISFETAARKGEPFKAMIAKYGIPNIMFNHCSRELKRRAIRSYARSIGWKPKDYQTAIGVRVDEIDRMSDDRLKERLLYPLVKAGITKPFINRFWREMPFRLELKGYEGNCKVCWKKSLRKLLTIAKEHPERFDEFKEWEREYGNFVPATRNQESTPVRFYRNGLTVNDIIEMSKKPFRPATDDAITYRELVQLGLFDEELDLSNGCVESCEPF